MSTQHVYTHERPAAEGQGLDNTLVRISAAVGRDDYGEPWVTLTWERDDFPAKSRQPIQMTITVEEFQGIATGIVDALDANDLAARLERKPS